VIVNICEKAALVSFKDILLYFVRRDWGR